MDDWDYKDSMENADRQEEEKRYKQIEKIDDIIKIIGLAFHETEASSACETYCGTAIDMLKEFKEQEL